MDRTALFSPCRTFRYRLGRRWSDGPVLAFIMLNPSCADEHVDDPSVRRCIGFAHRLGYGGLQVVNLYAFLATDPAELRRAGYRSVLTTTSRSLRPFTRAAGWWLRGAFMQPASGARRRSSGC